MQTPQYVSTIVYQGIASIYPDLWASLGQHLPR